MKYILRVTDSKLLHKSKIYEDTKLISIQKEIKLFCLQFYYKKNMVEDRFDNINITITNSKGEIQMNLIRKQKSTISNKAGNSQILLPLDTGQYSNLDRNSSPWLSDNEKDNINNINNLGNQQFL